MKPFCKLADPGRYVACDLDLSVDAEARAWWVDFFKRHFATLLAQAIDAAVARGQEPSEVRERADRCREKCRARFDDFAARPREFGRVTLITFDQWRDRTLREFGFPDALIDHKQRENEKMLPLLPLVCREIDKHSGREQACCVIKGVFAGNIFDLGSEATARSFMNQSPDFFSITGRLAPRPWLIDDCDALVDRLLSGPVHRKAVFFVDNAGSDFLLGAVPMMRWLAMRGTRIVLAANEGPTLNDMTIHEVRAWWPRVVAAEPSLATAGFELVSTGTFEPLIDLSAVSDELNAASGDADLVILEGMGRAVESNLNARFACDALKIGMIKMPIVAARLGGKLYDLVCRFEAPSTTPRTNSAK